MEDYKFSLPVKESIKKHRKPLSPADRQLMKHVLDRIEREGPLTVADFEDDRKEVSSGWWDYRPSKLALERLYMEGSLMITRTKDFRKKYDLPLNLVPADIDQTMPTPEQYARHVIKRTLKVLGIAYAKELAWRGRFVKDNLIKHELKNMVTHGEVLQVNVQGLEKAVLYMLPGYQDHLITLTDDARILSPFDPLNVFRHRLKDFFDFDYQIECFVPAAKRKYGYFSLPVLIGNQFVARMDSKADRNNKILIVHNLHFESVSLSDHQLHHLGEALKRYIVFNGCRAVVFKKTNNNQYLKVLKHLVI